MKRALLVRVAVCLLAALSVGGNLAGRAWGGGVVAAQDGTPTPAQVTASPSDVTIWWPVAAYPEAESTARALLNEHFAQYQGERGVRVTVRLKPTNGAGSIAATLPSASVVAPSVMPDLVLLRRDDLLIASVGRLAMALDVAAVGVDDWFAPALALGQIGGAQQGLPYILHLEHAIYRRSAFAEPPRTLDGVVEAGQPFLFPANAKGNQTVLAQYLAAGGRLVNEAGLPIVDRAPLVATLRDYERAVAGQVIDKSWLDYAAPGDYLASPIFTKAALIQINSWHYLRLADPDLFAVSRWPVPSGAVGGYAIVDGWLWAITASDVRRRDRALELLRWMLDSQRYGAFTREAKALPSRQSALAVWNTAYARFAAPLLDGPTVPPPDTIAPAVRTALQTAFEDVLTGKQGAEAAADAAIINFSQAKPTD
jgi:ABC-type glycerol-3-phosphate transport system substrate-binding protein